MQMHIICIFADRINRLLFDCNLSINNRWTRLEVGQKFFFPSTFVIPSPARCTLACPCEVRPQAARGRWCIEMWPQTCQRWGNVCISRSLVSYNSCLITIRLRTMIKSRCLKMRGQIDKIIIDVALHECHGVSNRQTPFLCVQQLVSANNKRNTRAPHYCPFVKGNTPVIGGFASPRSNIVEGVSMIKCQHDEVEYQCCEN